VKVSDLKVDSNTNIHGNKNYPLGNRVYKKPTHAKEYLRNREDAAYKHTITSPLMPGPETSDSKPGPTISCSDSTSFILVYLLTLYIFF
jgi:hypothetical protein